MSVAGWALFALIFMVDVFIYIWITCIFDGTLDKIHGEDEDLK